MTTAQHSTGNPDLARRLRSAREARGLTQQALAAAARFAGVRCSAAYISRCESGERFPSRRLLAAWAESLGCSALWLEQGLSVATLDLDAHELEEINRALSWREATDLNEALRAKVVAARLSITKEATL